MKIAANIVGVLLGLVFIPFSVMFLFNLMGKMPDMPPGSPADHFMQAFVPTGYMKFVKVFELVGGILVVIPKTRNLGLLILGPIIINILAFHTLIMSGQDIAMPAVLGAFALFLLWCERRSFAALIH